MFFDLQGFPKLWDLCGVPILRITVVWGLYWGRPSLGNYHITMMHCDCRIITIRALQVFTCLTLDAPSYHRKDEVSGHRYLKIDGLMLHAQDSGPQRVKCQLGNNLEGTAVRDLS